MLRWLKYLIIVPLAIVFLAFAYANRHFVSVAFDPLDEAGAGPYALQAPQFVVILVSVALGVIAGGVATWFGQSRYRRAARDNRAEIERLRADLQATRASAPLALARRA